MDAGASIPDVPTLLSRRKPVAADAPLPMSVLWMVVWEGWESEVMAVSPKESMTGLIHNAECLLPEIMEDATVSIMG